MRSLMLVLALFITGCQCCKPDPNLIRFINFEIYSKGDHYYLNSMGHKEYLLLSEEQKEAIVNDVNKGVPMLIEGHYVHERYLKVEVISEIQQ